MNYLTHEISLKQAESQRIDANVAQLMASATQQDQLAAAANTRAAAARADVTRLTNEANSLHSQAAGFDTQVASLNQQITQLTQDAPDQYIEVEGGKPPRRLNRGTPRGKRRWMI